MTIGQLAKYAKVSTRTIRHYHQIGLLPEPERDSSGYRRYTTDDVIRLVRIRGLADAGVPLARVAELLDSDGDDFTEAIAQVDADLHARIDELSAHRERLAELTSPDAGILGPKALEVLETMAEWEVAPEFLQIEREALILMNALYPKQAEEWLDWQLEAFGDPEVREVYELSYEAVDWDVDDLRIEGLCQRSLEITLKHHPPQRDSANDWWQSMDPISFELVDQHGTANSPVWKKITERMKELLLEAGYDVP